MFSTKYSTSRKPFRSRSFSLGSQRKGKAAGPETNNLLRVAGSYDEEFGGLQRAREVKKSLCDFFTRRHKENAQVRTAQKQREMKHTILYGSTIFRYVCSATRFVGMTIIFLAFGLHLQYQWHMGNYVTEIIILSTTAITTFAFVVVLYLFFHLTAFSRGIVHFWVSLAYGVLFLQDTHLRLLNKTIMICVFVSTGLRCLCSFVERLFRLPVHRSQFVSESEICDFAAFSLACVLLPPQKCLDLWLEMATLGFLLMNTRMKSPLCIGLIAVYATVTGISVIGNLGVKANKYSFVCFVVRMLWDPILDLYFSRLLPLTRWRCFFQLSKMLIYPFLTVLFLLELVFLGIALQAIGIHPKYEWPIILPFITVSGLGWLSMHAVYFVVHISFLKQVAMCKRLNSEEKFSEMSLQQILSGQGMRSLSGICYGVTSGCLFVTGLFGAICWRRKDGCYPALFLLLLTIESLSLALFAHLATYLRGTCYGYGIVASSSAAESKLGLVLPSETVEVQTMVASGMMNAIQNFFRTMVIESLGCDCWSRGAKLSLASVETKLSLLFSKRTTNGDIPYDNYVVYFSGMADEEGSWLLADGRRLSLDKIIKLWQDRPGSSWHNKTRSRLVLISDAPNSKAWLQKVKKLDLPVILQTCTYTCDEQTNSRSVVEEGVAKRGDFSLLWTSFLRSLQIKRKQDDELIESHTNDFIYEARAQGLLAEYAYSSSYLRSALSPCSGDFSTHRYTYCCLPVVIMTSCLSRKLFSIVSCALLRRLWFCVKTKCFGRKMWNLGEGFVLINS